MGVFDKIFQGDDSNKEVDEILAKAKRLLDNQFYDWAGVEFNKAMEMDPKYASNTITKLYQEMQGGGNPDGMISLGATVLQQDPENLELANILGNAYRKKKDWNHAKNMYQHCLKYDPHSEHAAYNLAASIAKVDLADGNAVSAIAEFENLSGFVLPDNTEGEEKLRDLQQYLEVEPEPVEESEEEPDKTSMFSESPAGEGEDDEAAAEAKAEEEAKAKAEAAAKAKELADKMSEIKADNEVEEEEGDVDDVIKIDPLRTLKYITSHFEAESEEESSSCFALGIYCLREKEGFIAQRSFERLLMRDKGNIELRCFLVLAISLKGAIDKAINTLQGIQGRNPNHRYTNVNLGYLYKRQGKKLQARVCFFTTYRLLESSQGHYDIQVCLDEAAELVVEKKGKKALEIYEPLIPEITSDALLGKIASLFVEEKMWDEAMGLYKRILHHDRKSAEARKGLKKIHEAYLMEVENLLKKQDAKNAAVVLDKAIGIAPSKVLLQKGITLNRVLENENRAMELERMLQKINKKELQGSVQEKISLAEEAESKGNIKGAIRYYEEAIRIDPDHATLKKMVDLCYRIKRPDLAEKLTDWFNKLEESVLEKEKIAAREAFKQDRDIHGEPEEEGEEKSADDKT